MSRLSRWETVAAELTARGLDLASEQGRTISAWLWRELDHDPPGRWLSTLGDVADRAVEIYTVFLTEFEDCYLAENAPGPGWVKQALRNQFGFAAEPAVHAVLERIRDRRCHLLRHFRERYQPRLFGPPTFEPAKVRSYLRRVAWFEGRKAPLELLHIVASTPTARMDDWMLPLSDDTADEPAFQNRARLLDAFWGQSNRFTRSMRLEGLVSLGLGFLTGEPELAGRCRQHLLERLPAWEARWDELTARLRRLLDRQGSAEARLPSAHDPAEREEIERELAGLRERLASLRLRVQHHLDRLLPRPATVQKLLTGFVNARVGTIRFQRIGREIEVMEERIRNGARELRQLGLPAPADRLLPAVERHLATRPASPRQHGLARAVRARRRQCHAAWLDTGLALAAQLRSALTRSYPPQDSRRGVVTGWLCDAVDLYELGVLDRVGVAGGLRRQGWRLERLLRRGQ